MGIDKRGLAIPNDLLVLLLLVVVVAWWEEDNCCGATTNAWIPRGKMRP